LNEVEHAPKESTGYFGTCGERLPISQDAIVRDKRQDKSNDQAAGAEAGTSEPKGQELVYTARVSLDRTQMQVEENLVNLSAGMAATVEIKTGSRRIIDYLLSPGEFARKMTADAA
jgi:hemolysin D